MTKNIFSSIQSTQFLTIALGVFLTAGASFHTSAAPANDDCANAAPLTDGVYASEDTTSATDDAAPDFGTIAKGVWFSFTPTVTASQPWIRAPAISTP